MSAEQDYLWDGAGEADPEVARLEEALGGLRYRRELPELPEQTPPGSLFGPMLAMAAAALIVAGLALVYGTGSGSPQAPVAKKSPTPVEVDERASWDVALLAGKPIIGQAPLAKKRGKLRVGEWLQTDASSQARIQVADIGRVDIGPSSRVRLVKTNPNEHRLQMAVGKLHAKVNAPPRLFLVDTPSAQAVDLGCEYTLTVDAKGVGTLDVSLGQVAFEWRKLESVVPRGARCQTFPNHGPGTPFYKTSTRPFREALARLDGELRAGLARKVNAASGALRDVLAGAKTGDDLSLWHLLPRLPRALRGQVFDRLHELVKAPERVTRAGVIAGDKAMLGMWKEMMDWSW